MTGDLRTDNFIDARSLILEQMHRQASLRKVGTAVLVLVGLVFSHWPMLARWMKGANPFTGGQTGIPPYFYSALALSVLVVVTTVLVLGWPLVRRRILAALALVAAATMYGSMAVSSEPETYEHFVSLGAKCFYVTTMYTAIVLGVFFVARKLLRRSPSSLFMLGVLGTAVAVTTMYHQCPAHGMLHILLCHGGALLPAAILAVVFFLPSRKMS
ncbi:MAG: hypothetical protein H6685_13380 [Deltaproteobacteria bacterium]|nr:hypothetical protein [Deltaproteobacteria bacterium]